MNPSVSTRARTWKKGGLKRITLHECRHALDSPTIIADTSARAESILIGDANSMD
jgi:hypothetical protein